MGDMDKLVELLEELYDGQNNSMVSEEDNKDYFICNLATYDEIDYLASKLLITEEGKCNWENINLLKSRGYNVFAGDKDSFGWLTGCIQKKDDDRIFIYG